MPLVIDHSGPDPVEGALPKRASQFSAQESVLVARCLNGEEAACSELFHRYYRLLMPICLRYARNTDEAKDIMQEGFARIFTKLHSYSGKGHFIGWLKRVLVNTAINHYRSSLDERSNVRIDELGQQGAPGEEGTTEDAISNLAVDELLALVQGLSPAYRMVFNLRVMEGWTHEEIAQELGISVGASKSNLSRARVKLMEQVVARYPSRSFKRSNER